MSDQRLRIILAEDDEGHAALIQRNLQRARLNAEIIRVSRGHEVMEVLQRQMGTGAQVQPLLVLLDIRMPGMDGTEVLQVIKSNPQTRSIPVYMLTTTDDPREIARCFSLGCNVYLNKPVDYGAFTATIQRLCEFLEISQLPGPNAANHVFPQ